jgi:hypothetical protein
VCFLALASAVTLEDVMDEEEDTDSKESFISWLRGFWLLCLLGIVVVLMRLCNHGHHDSLYQLSMGMLAFFCVFLAVDCIVAASYWDEALLFVSFAIYYFVKECRRQSPCMVTAWFCNAQMMGLFFFVALIFFIITLHTILLKVPISDALEWTELIIMGILTVSCFVVTFLAPPVIILVEEPPDPVAQEQQNDISSSNVEYERA